MITTYLAHEFHWWRVAHLGTNRLVRPVDRIESVLQAGLAIAAITVVPILIVGVQAVYTDTDRPHDHREAIVATILAAFAMGGTLFAVYAYIAGAIKGVADSVRNRAWEREWKQINKVHSD